jgi:hypothetical protein
LLTTSASSPSEESLASNNMIDDDARQDTVLRFEENVVDKRIINDT